MKAISLTMHSMDINEYKMFEDLVSNALTCLQNCIKFDLQQITSNDDVIDTTISLSHKFMEILQDIAEHEPILFKNSLDNYVNALTMIIKNNQFRNNLQCIRSSALEILITFVQSDPNMCKNSQIFVNGVINALFESILLDNESDEEWNQDLVCIFTYSA